MNKTMSLIFQFTADEFELTVDEILAKDRHQTPVLARHCALYLSRNLTKLSFQELARDAKLKDHTTVMSACKSYARRLVKDTDLVERTDRITERVGQAQRHALAPKSEVRAGEESWVAKIASAPFAEAG